MQDGSIEKIEGSAGRVQGGERSEVRPRDVLQKLADFRAAEVTGMPLVVKEYEAANPGNPIVCGSVVVSDGTHGVADLIEQSGCLGRCQRLLSEDRLLIED